MSAKILEFPSVEQRHLEAEEQRIGLMLEVLDSMRESILSGDMQEFVACSIDSTDEFSIHLCASSYVGGIGMFEMGKSILIEMER